jgi:ABC-type transport system involved in cytochrome c biogenesis permease subunit
MKKYFSAFVALLALSFVGFSLRAPRNPGAFDIVGFGRLPVLVNGRVKPLDTVARTTLLTLQGRQHVTTRDGRTLVPVEWLLGVLYRPALADSCQTFAIVHPEVLALFGLAPADGAGGKRFSFTQLARGLRELDRQAKLADDVENAARSTFQRAVVQLRDNIVLYQRLQQTLMPAGVENYFEQLARLQRIAPIAAARGDDAKFALELGRAFSAMDTFAYFRPIPPETDATAMSGWQTAGASLDAGLTSGRFNPAALFFADAGRAWCSEQPEVFNRAVHAYRARLDRGAAALMRKCDVEARFNVAQPFYTSAVLYVLAFLLAVVSWLRSPATLGAAAFALVGVAFALATAGIVARMWLEARPPVTNLYSSALFVGWGAVALCLVLEYFFRNAIGSVAAGLIGFATLLIAHHLALGGDTLEMMRAVLDSNFWLATHVVTIAVGYSATFLAGFLAAIYVVRGVLTRSLERATADALARMVYGIVCFATLFSFVGTILGGIWADQSWGRFWGWDPKENGALMIVIWNSIILHARWGGVVRQRGLMALAIFGNVITAWSWFGVNMLGVGLHSYGFMDAAFWWLVAFVVSQLALILLAAVPAVHWRSLRETAAGPRRPAGTGLAPLSRIT